MQPNPSLKKLVEFLEGKGLADEKIAELGDEMTKQGFMMLYTNAMAAFTEEDVKAVEDCETDEKANEKIIELYAIRTGRNPQEEMNIFLTKVVEEYINGYDKEPDKQVSS